METTKAPGQPHDRTRRFSLSGFGPHLRWRRSRGRRPEAQYRQVLELLHAPSGDPAPGRAPRS